MLFLTPAELVDLTGKVRRSAQVRALAMMKIPFVVRPDGQPRVSRSYLCDKLGEREPEEIEQQPDWSSLNAT
jgi:hypothetical protein